MSGDSVRAETCIVSICRAESALTRGDSGGSGEGDCDGDANADTDTDGDGTGPLSGTSARLLGGTSSVLSAARR